MFENILTGVTVFVVSLVIEEKNLLIFPYTLFQRRDLFR